MDCVLVGGRIVASLHALKRQPMSSKCLKTPALRVAILQLNVEGLTTFKIANLEQLARNNVTVIALQETHLEKTNILGVPGYRLAVHTINKHHDIATFVHKDSAA